MSNIWYLESKTYKGFILIEAKKRHLNINPFGKIYKGFYVPFEGKVLQEAWSRLFSIKIESRFRIAF